MVNIPPFAGSLSEWQTVLAWQTAGRPDQNADDDSALNVVVNRRGTYLPTLARKDILPKLRGMTRAI